jgi:multidrug efflux pump subunit AcrA (membrane-fusion protein)
MGHTRSGDDIDKHWDDDTTAAVKRWQKAAGLPVDGVLDLGEIVFLNEPIRITSVEAALGGGVGPGGPVLTGTSNRQVVRLDLEAADHDLVAVGDAVSIELPDGTTTDGTITAIATVAETTTDQQGGTTTSLPVTVSLDDPAAAGSLDEAPVEVIVVTEQRENVLTVPVNALVALLEGGYAVEVVEAAAPDAEPAASGSPSASDASSQPTRLVPVEPGLFDRGFVEVTADGLEDGDLVVVPS